jgi:hypothetical protein
MRPDPVGVQVQPLGQLFGRRRSTQVTEEREQPRSRRLRQGVAGSGRYVHAAQFCTARLGEPVDHIGANTWESAGAAPPPPGAAALRHATIVLPDGAERNAPEQTPEGPMVRDPSGSRLLLT